MFSEARIGCADGQEHCHKNVTQLSQNRGVACLDERCVACLPGER